MDAHTARIANGTTVLGVDNVSGFLFMCSLDDIRQWASKVDDRGLRFAHRVLIADGPGEDVAILGAEIRRRMAAAERERLLEEALAA